MRRLAYALLVGGLVLLVAGIAVITASAKPAAFHMPPDDAAFVGSETCIGCHSSSHANGFDSSHAVSVTALKTRLQTTATDVRTRDPEPAVSGLTYRHHFLVETEEGILILPGWSNRSTDTWGDSVPMEDAFAAECMTCHTAEGDPAVFVDSRMICEACHGPGSSHVDVAQVAPDPLRSMSVIEADPYADDRTYGPICASCHAPRT
ncbi:MAG: hypothetical protein K8J31_21895 [Anaerolineae bacterium]|nr:hypothetical protein [Anaerolineae bacterium]